MNKYIGKYTTTYQPKTQNHKSDLGTLIIFLLTGVGIGMILMFILVDWETHNYYCAVVDKKEYVCRKELDVRENY